MVNRGIIICVFDRPIGMSRHKARPNFTSDKSAVTVSVMIIIPTGQRRLQSIRHIIFTCPILRPISDYICKPIITQYCRINFSSVSFGNIQPYKLQVQIVIRLNSFGHILCIKINVVYASVTFKRCAESSSYVFTQPASSYLIFIFMYVQAPDLLCLFLTVLWYNIILT